MRYSTNLFPVKVEKQVFSVFKPDIELGKELINRLLYRLSQKTGLPCFYRRGRVYLAGRSGEEKISITLGESFVNLYFQGEEETRPETCEEVSQFLAEPLRRLSSREEIRAVNKLRDIVLIRKLDRGVIHSEKGPLLRIDFSHSVVERKTVKELMEEGFQEEELMRSRFKPAGTDTTFELTEILYNVSEEDRKTIREMATNPVVREYMEKRIRKNEPFLVLDGKYRYPAGVVRRSLRLEDIEEDVRKDLFRKVKVGPEERQRKIHIFANLAKHTLSRYGVHIGNAVETESVINFPDAVIDAEGNVYEDKDRTLKAVVYGRPFIKDKKLKIAVIDVSEDKKGTIRVLNDIISFLEDKGFVCESDYFRLSGASRREIKKKFYDLKLDIASYSLGIVFLKDFGKAELFDEGTLYDFFKSSFLKEFVPTQVIREETVHNWNKYILYNIAEGIMGKTGNVPYKLANHLENVDIFVGLDISRAKLKKGRGTVNASAVTKIFLNNGEFLKFSVETDPVGGETLTSRTLDTLAGNIYRHFGLGKRVVVHRDGRFQKGEVDVLLKVFREYDLEEPVLVEIVKSGNPRFFPNPEKGLSLILSSDTAVLSTYRVRQEAGNHMPVRLNRVYGDMDIETLASHTLALTMLNYGATTLAKLPATTYYPDRISYLALRGISPPSREGNKMYWL